MPYSARSAEQPGEQQNADARKRKAAPRAHEICTNTVSEKFIEQRTNHKAVCDVGYIDIAAHDHFHCECMALATVVEFLDPLIQKQQ